MAQAGQNSVIRFIETEADLAEGAAYLSQLCPILAQLAETISLPLRRRKSGFASLVSIVLAQQLSVAAADTIEKRLVARLKKLTPDTILKARSTSFRACGVSAPKIRTLKALAKAVKSRELDFKKVDTAHPELARDMLTKVSGIGPWTSDIYIMFALGHADGFAPGDLALQEAVRMAYGWKKRPDPDKLEGHARQWAPWRGVAARLLWAHYAQVKKAKKLAEKRPGVKKAA